MLFVDTNILLYAISNHPSEAEKNQKARKSLETEIISMFLLCRICSACPSHGNHRNDRKSNDEAGR